MSTIMFLHAHPDDEASATSGTMARAVAEGHKVVCTYATNGDWGDVPDDLGDETLVERRRREAACSARAIGTSAVHWLGYADSGMTGWEQNNHEGAFASADVDEAAARLLAIIDAEGVDILVGYDWHGNYGHPDHIAVHRVARRAVELSPRPLRLLETTMNRDRWRRLAQAVAAAGGPVDMDPDGPADDGNPVGTPEAELQWSVDVSAHLDTKRRSLACHASQAKDIGMFLSIEPETFAVMFDREFYLEPGLDQPMTDGWPFPKKDRTPGATEWRA